MRHRGRRSGYARCRGRNVPISEARLRPQLPGTGWIRLGAGPASTVAAGPSSGQRSSTRWTSSSDEPLDDRAGRRPPSGSCRCAPIRAPRSNSRRRGRSPASTTRPASLLRACSSSAGSIPLRRGLRVDARRSARAAPSTSSASQESCVTNSPASRNSWWMAGGAAPPRRNRRAPSRAGCPTRRRARARAASGGVAVVVRRRRGPPTSAPRIRASPPGRVIASRSRAGCPPRRPRGTPARPRARPAPSRRTAAGPTRRARENRRRRSPPARCCRGHSGARW